MKRTIWNCWYAEILCTDRHGAGMFKMRGSGMVPRVTHDYERLGSIPTPASFPGASGVHLLPGVALDASRVELGCVR